MSMYATKAWPTRYAGVEFRSRLEARWAAFFDLAKIEWDYEPFDLKGWTPDFILADKRNSLLVEVKPIEWQDASFDKAICADLGGTTSRALCVGISPLVDFGNDGYGYDVDHAFGFGPSDAKFFWCLSDSAKLGIASIQDGWWCAEDWKDALYSLQHRGRGPLATDDLVRAYWRDAGNIVQWRPRGGR